MTLIGTWGLSMLLRIKGEEVLVEEARKKKKLIGRETDKQQQRGKGGACVFQ